MSSKMEGLEGEVREEEVSGWMYSIGSELSEDNGEEITG